MKKIKLVPSLLVISIILSVATLGFLIFNKTNPTKVTPEKYVVVYEINSSDNYRVIASGWDLTTRQGKKDEDKYHTPTEVIDANGKVIATSFEDEIKIDVSDGKEKK